MGYTASLLHNLCFYCTGSLCIDGTVESNVVFLLVGAQYTMMSWKGSNVFHIKGLWNDTSNALKAHHFPPAKYNASLENILKWVSSRKLAGSICICFWKLEVKNLIKRKKCPKLVKKKKKKVTCIFLIYFIPQENRAFYPLQLIHFLHFIYWRTPRVSHLKRLFPCRSGTEINYPFFCIPLAFVQKPCWHNQFLVTWDLMSSLCRRDYLTPRTSDKWKVLKWCIVRATNKECPATMFLYKQMKLKVDVILQSDKYYWV